MVNKIVQLIEEFTETKLLKAARHFDAVDDFPKEEVDTLFGSQFLVALYNETLLYEDYVSCIRSISHHFPALSSILLTQESHAIWPLHRFGTTEQKSNYLDDLLTGKIYGSFALNEAGTGSELSEMKTLAIETETGWELSGAKSYISNAPIAKLLLVVAKTRVLDGTENYGIFLVESDTKGVVVSQPEDKMGIKALPVAGFTLDKVKVTKQALLGAELAGEQQVFSVLNRNRLSVAAQGIGIAEGSFARGLDYVSFERNIGKRLIDFSATRDKLAEIETKIYTAKALLKQVISENKEDARLVAMAKLTASNLAIDTTEMIISLTGGHGYMKHNDIERLVRDAKITAIYGSSSERLRNIISAPWLVRKK